MKDLCLNPGFKPGGYVGICLMSVLMTISTYNARAQPRISSFTPTHGPVGSIVIIKGDHFNITDSNNIVHFGGTRARVIEATSNTLTVEVPVVSNFQPITVTTNSLIATAGQIFNVTFAGGKLFSPTSFVPDSCKFLHDNTYSTGNYNADLDGDGKPDLIFVDESSVSIYRNTASNGNISFDHMSSFSVYSKSKVVFSDLDGDGKLELVVIETGYSGMVSFFRNTSSVGKISFGKRLDYLAEIETTCDKLSVGDLDGDGKNDLVLLNATLKKIVILKNKSQHGLINFEPGLTITSTSSPNNVSINDLDGDGKIDLVLSNSVGNYITVFRNTSSIHTISVETEKHIPIPSTAAFTEVMLADLNGDGKPEVFGCNDNMQSLLILKNTGTAGSILFSAGLEVTLSYFPKSFSVADIDGDGKPDIVASNWNALFISVFKNLSNPNSISFSAKNDYSTGNSPQSYITIGDFNVDGKPDFALSNYSYIGTINFHILINAIDGPSVLSFSPKKAKTGDTVTIKGANFRGATAVHFGITSAAKFKLVNDSTITAVVGNGSSPDVSVTTASGTGRLSSFTFFQPGMRIPSISSFYPSTGFPGSTVIITGNNFKKVPAANTVYFGAARAKVLFASETSLIVTVPDGSTYRPLTVTSNNMTAYSNLPFNVRMKRRGPITDSTFAPRIGVPAAGTDGVSVCDFNGDGNIDIAAVSPYKGYVSIMTKMGAENELSFQAKLSLEAGVGPTKSAVGDFDGDGKPDLVISNNTSFTLTTFLNTSSAGRISFAAKKDFPAYKPFDLYVTDVNGDGKPDIVNTSKPDKFGTFLEVYMNVSTSKGIIDFDRRRVQHHVGKAGLAIADFDGDGKPDIAFDNSSNSTVSIMKNTSTMDSISFGPLINLPRINVYGYETILSITAGDVDGDGKTDLALTRFDGKIVILRNRSTRDTIAMETPVTFQCPRSSYSISMNDVDGDGKPDLIVYSIDFTITVSIFKNISNAEAIAFAPPIAYKAGIVPGQIVICDFNADGAPDILISGGGESMSLLTNENRGTDSTLELFNFTAVELFKQISLRWQMHHDNNTDSSSIEHSKDGVTFSTIGTIPARGNNSPIADYQFRHVNPTPGTNYYRLKNIRNDLQFAYSPVISIDVKNDPPGLTLYPNPARDKLVIEHPSFDGYSLLKIINVGGQLIKTIRIDKNIGQTNTSVKMLSPGLYKVVWSNGIKTFMQSLIVN